MSVSEKAGYKKNTLKKKEFTLQPKACTGTIRLGFKLPTLG